MNRELPPATVGPPLERAELEARWMELTRQVLPGLATERDWPVRHDHCFQRILLDHMAGGPWRETIAAPAYRNMAPSQLRAAIALAEAARDGALDLREANTRSLRWRGKLLR